LSSRTSSIPSSRATALGAAVLVSYCIFAFGSTFSTALAQIALGISAVLFAVVCFISRCNPFSGQLRSLYIVLGALVGWRIISALASTNPISGLGDVREDWLYVALPIGIWLLQKEKYRGIVVSALMIGVVIVSVYAFVQNTTGFEYRGRALTPAPDFGFRAIGTFHNELTFGNFFAVMAMTFLGAGVIAFRDALPKWRIIFLGAALLSAVASGLSYSRGSLLAMVPGTIVGCWLLARYRARWVALAVLVIGIGFIYAHPGIIYRMTTEIVTDQTADNVMSRQYIWTHTLSVVGDNLIYGTGPGQFRAAYLTTLPENVKERAKHSHAHNDLLTVAAETGIIGTGLFAVLWLTVIMQTIKGIKLVSSFHQMLPVAAIFGITAFLITGLTESSFHDEEMCRMLMLVWAFGLWPLGGTAETSPDFGAKSS
jgi:O-antigen ligase